MRRSVVLVAMAVAATLAAGVVGVVRHESSPERARATAPTTSPPTTAAPASPALSRLDAVVAELRAFVERERGLAFKRPVKVALLDDAAFNARVVSKDPEVREDVADSQGVLQAMGLLPPGIDLWTAVVGFVEESALGFYDATTDELVVRGAEPTPYVRTTLVHELTHALEDQHFDLHRPDLGDEAALGFEALVEGSALRIEARYLASLPAAERRQVAEAERADGAGPDGEVPAVVEEGFGFAYIHGPALVRSIVGAGGQARLNRAYAEPPLSSEQVLHPVRYLLGDRPRPALTPEADRPAFDDGEIGELFLVLMLDARLGRAQAVEAAGGWGGDRYVAWKEGPRSCVRASFAMDTPADTDQLVRALADWSRRRPGQASSAGTTLTTCG